jgi:hypothetical protein
MSIALATQKRNAANRKTFARQESEEDIYEMNDMMEDEAGEMDLLGGDGDGHDIDDKMAMEQ